MPFVQSDSTSWKSVSEKSRFEIEGRVREDCSRVVVSGATVLSLSSQKAFRLGFGFLTVQVIASSPHMSPAEDILGTLILAQLVRCIGFVTIAIARDDSFVEFLFKPCRSIAHS